jgi:hypothetical protein
MPNYPNDPNSPNDLSAAHLSESDERKHVEMIVLYLSLSACLIYLFIYYDRTLFVYLNYLFLVAFIIVMIMITLIP